MATDWGVRAREIAAKSYEVDADLIARYAALAAEAFREGEQKHGEHHKCERCFAAGHAAGVKEAQMFVLRQCRHYPPGDMSDARCCEARRLGIALRASQE